jgi:hypothetical protein
MKRAIKTVIFVGALAFAAGCQSAESTKQSSATERKAEGRRKQIQREFDKLGKHPWAGKYYHGDGLGVNVSLYVAPASGFAFSWHGCLGLYDQNYGAVVETNGVLKLTFDLPNERRGFQGLAPAFVPVRWGPRTYLVAFDEMADFCNAVNSKREPRNDMHGRHLLREGDEKKRATGEPQVPAAFKKHLLKKPIVAIIVAIGKVSTRPSVADFKFKDIEVTLNVGKKDGLLPGMELGTISNRTSDSVKITSVEDDQAFGLITQIGEDDPMPKVGWRFSTKR